MRSFDGPYVAVVDRLRPKRRKHALQPTSNSPLADLRRAVGRRTKTTSESRRRLPRAHLPDVTLRLDCRKLDELPIDGPSSRREDIFALMWGNAR